VLFIVISDNIVCPEHVIKNVSLPEGSVGM